MKKGAKYLDLKGIFTHLCVADTPSQDEVTRKQIQEFRKVCVSMNEVGLQEIHCLNSVEGLWYPPSVGDFSR
ncbi:TPA: alanine racemase, partial [Enterococcus faecium]